MLRSFSRGRDLKGPAYGISTLVATALVILVMLGAFVLPVIALPPGAPAPIDWTSTTNYPLHIASNSCALDPASDYIYCVGGFTGSYVLSVYYAPLSAGNYGVGSWSAGPLYDGGAIAGIGYASCVIDGNYEYLECVGGFVSPGFNSINAVYYIPLSPGGGFLSNSWSLAPNAYPTAIDSESCVSYLSYIYCVGGFTNNVQNHAVYSAALGSTGPGAWASQNTYPGPSYRLSCAAIAGYIYCLGPDSSVYSATLLFGAVGPWTKQANSYPPGASGADGARCVVNSVYAPYLYCIGGYNTNGAVYYAQLSPGAVGSWTQSTPYPIAAYTGDCVILQQLGGYVYCIGGYVAGNTVNQVYSGVPVTPPTTTTSTSTVTSTSTTTSTSTSTTTVTSTTSQTSTVTSTTTATAAATTVTSTAISTTTATSTVTAAATTNTVTSTATVTSTSTAAATTTTVAQPGTTTTVTQPASTVTVTSGVGPGGIDITSFAVPIGAGIAVAGAAIAIALRIRRPAA